MPERQNLPLNLLPRPCGQGDPGGPSPEVAQPIPVQLLECPPPAPGHQSRAAPQPARRGTSPGRAAAPAAPPQLLRAPLEPPSIRSRMRRSVPGASAVRAASATAQVPAPRPPGQRLLPVGPPRGVAASPPAATAAASRASPRGGPAARPTARRANLPGTAAGGRRAHCSLRQQHQPGLVPAQGHHRRRRVRLRHPIRSRPAGGATARNRPRCHGKTPRSGHAAQQRAKGVGKTG